MAWVERSSPNPLLGIYFPFINGRYFFSSVAFDHGNPFITGSLGSYILRLLDHG